MRNTSRKVTTSGDGQKLFYSLLYKKGGYMNWTEKTKERIIMPIHPFTGIIRKKKKERERELDQWLVSVEDIPACKED